EQQTREFNREVDTHYRNTPVYRHLENDVDDLVRLADHIHDVAHGTRERRHLRDDVNRFERQLQHVENIVDRLPRLCGADRTTVQHLRREIDRLEDAVNDLQRAL